MTFYMHTHSVQSRGLSEHKLFFPSVGIFFLYITFKSYLHGIEIKDIQKSQWSVDNYKQKIKNK